MWRRVDLVWTDVPIPALACYLLAHLHRPFPCGPLSLPSLFLYSWLSLQPPAHADSSLAKLSTLKMEAIRSSETSVHTRSARRYIPEDGILHSHRLETLKSYMNITRSEYSHYTCYEEVLRNVRSKSNTEISVLFIWSRLRAINCFSLEF
jgi:hypothetical protein